ncbi:MAG TPA: N-acetylmuramoyl-L-alanine amidase [Chloroflexota bacterium]|nr:N-acetylmuramoyl-L-alanine amidase [Chloroflexota bacterium]
MIRRWRSSNCWLGRPYGLPIAFVIHTETGGESGTVAEFLSSSSHLSTHYAVGLDGSIDCFVDPDDRAWSNGILEPGNLWAAIADDCKVDPALNPNHVTVTCDTQDGGEANLDVSDDQYNAVLYAAWEAMQRYPTSLRYLARHADISPQSRPGCPGDRWLESGRFQTLADTLGLKTTSGSRLLTVGGGALRR